MDEWIHDTKEKIPLERQEGGNKNPRKRYMGKGQGVSAIIKDQTSESLHNIETSLYQIILTEFE